MRVQFLRKYDVNSVKYAQWDEADIDADIANDLIRGHIVRYLSDGDRHTHRWTDLTQGVSAVNPLGSTNPPSFDTTEDGFPGTLLFAGIAEDSMLAGAWQIVHEWEKGTAIHPHIHWALTANSAAAVTWEFYYRICGTGEVADAWVGPVAGTESVATGGVADTHAITSFGTIDLAGHTISTIVFWRLYRRIADANDDDVRLLSVDAHYRKDGTGSVGLYTK